MLRLFITFSSLVSAAVSLNIQTRIVHAGCEPENIGYAVVPPINVATTFIQASPGVKPSMDDPNSYGQGFYYSRQNNPSRAAFERALAAAENAQHCSAFSSGLAASQAVIQTLNSGDHVIALDDLYGGTSSYFRNIATPQAGIDFTFMNLDDISAVEAAMTPKTKLIWLESPTNPLLKTTDIRAITTLAKKKDIKVAVDSTFMSPYLQRPIELGADFVVHSVTKFIAGHSDVLMGAVSTSDAELNTKLRNIQNLAGAVPSPFDCYLALRGLKTLPLRMEAAQKNAIKIAEFLDNHPMIESVSYPGLNKYPQYSVAKGQTDGPGAMMSIYIKGGLPAASTFLSELKIIGLAVSLGAVESLACSPAIMTHGSVPVEAREKIGLTDSLIRISAGIEHPDDLVEDLEQALSKAQQQHMQNTNLKEPVP
mmetsp:Transcript_28074/g.47227  ORF Transcript_28074/g.47227 Transcript_28074/m.47227 type:complete len:424 (+) Transcript_28074:66-1337(+)